MKLNQAAVVISLSFVVSMPLHAGESSATCHRKVEEGHWNVTKKFGGGDMRDVSDLASKVEAENRQLAALLEKMPASTSEQDLIDIVGRPPTQVVRVPRWESSQLNWQFDENRKYFYVNVSYAHDCILWIFMHSSNATAGTFSKHNKILDSLP
jgi:hypothetical protein